MIQGFANSPTPEDTYSYIESFEGEDRVTLSPITEVASFFPSSPEEDEEQSQSLLFNQ
jgi:hypothetical protein